MKNEATLEQPQVVTEEPNNSQHAQTSYYEAGVNKRHLPQWALAWMVLVPALIFLILFMIYPIINAFIIAFLEDFSWVNGAGSFALSNAIAAHKLVGVIDPETGLPFFEKGFQLGFGNFAALFVEGTFSDGGFMKSLGNTGLIVIITVPVTIIVSLLISALLNSIKVLRSFFQTIFFLPYVTNTIAIGAVFNALFITKGGVVNVAVGEIVSWFGGTYDPINWIDQFASYWHAFVVILLYSVWNGLAFKILVFMGGLATIDKQYYDAARVDGAKGFTIFRRITVPLLSPQILYITVTSIIGSFKAYTGVKAVFVGGAGNDAFYFGGKFGKLWTTAVGWIYERIYDQKPGIAAAGSLTLLGIILIVTLLQYVVSNRRVHY